MSSLIRNSNLLGCSNCFGRTTVFWFPVDGTVVSHVLFPMGSGTRTQLSDSDRRQICKLHKANLSLSHQGLTVLAAEKLGKPGLARPTVTGILKESQKWLSCAASKKFKHRAAKHEELEAAVMEWVGQMVPKGGLPSNRLIVDKALHLAKALQLADFKASDGWLSKFKQRNIIKRQQLPQEQEVKTVSEDKQVVVTVSNSHQPAEHSDDEDDCDEFVEMVPAPSLDVVSKQLKGLATFLADNSEFSAEDEMALQRIVNKVTEMIVSRIQQGQRLAT